VRGGDGGAGCVSFRREGPEAFGGPNGGDGGDGGDVWLVADRNTSSLIAFKDHPHRRAVNGVHGKGKDQHGKRGVPLEISVPEGTVAYDMYTGELLADLPNHGDRWLAAHGGRGGRGNAKFWSNKRRAPAFAEQGEHGEDRWLRLERVEPDFIQSGEMTLVVTGRPFAQKQDVESDPFVFGPDTGKIDMREQRRELRLRFRSNVVNGDYQLGKTLLSATIGDSRPY
jgi:GTP-binding protein